MAAKMVNLVVRASTLPNKRDLIRALDEAPDPAVDQQKKAVEALQMEQGKAMVSVSQSQAQLYAARAQSEQSKAASDQAKAQASGAKVPSEIEKNQAQAARDGAAAQSTMHEMMQPTVTVIPGGF